MIISAFVDWVFMLNQARTVRITVISAGLAGACGLV
jgi:hypothetical protein